MEAIVLAGGLGNRLRSVVADVPKPMADIAGRPFLEYLLDDLVSGGVRRAVLAVSHMHELLQQHFAGRYWLIDLLYSVEAERRGTGGAILQAFEQVDAADALVLNGDTLFKVDIPRLAAVHETQKADITVALRRMPDCERYGTVETDDAGRIVGFREKQARQPGNINGGIYIISKRWMTRQPWPRAFSFEKDVLEACYQGHRFFAVPFDGYFIDIGIPDDYQRANRELPMLQ